MSPEKTQPPHPAGAEPVDPLSGLPEDQRGLGALMLMMQQNFPTELQATRGQLQRSEDESMRRHEVLLAANDRNEKSLAAAHKEIKKVMQVTDGLGKEIKDIRDEAMERDKKFGELEDRLNEKMRDMLQRTQAASASSTSSRTGPTHSGSSLGDEQELILGGWLRSRTRRCDAAVSKTLWVGLDRMGSSRPHPTTSGRSTWRTPGSNK